MTMEKKMGERSSQRGKSRQVGGKSLMRKLLSPFLKVHVLPPKNDVDEYLGGINVVSCGGARRKWTKFMSRKLHQLFFSCTLILKVHCDKNMSVQSSQALFAQCLIVTFFLYILYSMICASRETYKYYLAIFFC